MSFKYIQSRKIWYVASAYLSHCSLGNWEKDSDFGLFLTTNSYNTDECHICTFRNSHEKTGITYEDLVTWQFMHLKKRERKERNTASQHQNIGNTLCMLDCLSIRFRGRNIKLVRWSTKFSSKHIFKDWSTLKFYFWFVYLTPLCNCSTYLLFLFTWTLQKRKISLFT